MATMFHDGSRTLQDRFDTRRIADRIEKVLVHDFISEDDAAFIEAVDMFFIATADEERRPSCSYKGGEPGFVRVVDEGTIAFPSYDGNGMYLTMGNLLRNPNVGLLFDERDPLLADYPEAQFIVRIAVREVFPNCPRYIHRYALVQRSRFVPKADCKTPVPDWKRAEWARDALPAKDPAREA